MSMLLHACELELLKALNSCDVRYLVIGGHAVMFYGHYRPPHDLDIFIDRDGDNPSKVIIALRSIRFDPKFSPTDLTKPKTKIPLKYLDSELLTSAEGPPFGEAYTRRVIAKEKEILVSVVSFQDLLAQKRALGREKDLQDIEALEKLSTWRAVPPTQPGAYWFQSEIGQDDPRSRAVLVDVRLVNGQLTVWYLTKDEPLAKLKGQWRGPLIPFGHINRSAKG